MLGSGARGCAALIEALDAELPAPPCPDCGRPMERHRRIGKTLPARLGKVEIKRTQFRCRRCGGVHVPLDRALGLEGRNATPGAESVLADAASSDSYAEASRKLGNLAGVRVPASTLQRHGARIGREVQEFERADAGERKPPPRRVLVGIDGTGVPMTAGEVEGVPGKQEDGAAKTREAKAIVRYTAESRNPKTGEPRKDRGSGAAGVRIDSARSEGGISRASEFAARLERFGHREGLFEAGELVVLSDGAAWIRNVCEEVFAGTGTTFILDQFHALDCAAAAVRALAPDRAGRKARMERIKAQLNGGRVDLVIAGLKPHRHRDEAVEACVRYMEANKDRMRYDLYRKRGLPVGSGVVESACKRIVGSRFKRSGCRWSKAGANALLAAECCIDNNRWADFLDWRAGRAAAA